MVQNKEIIEVIKARVPGTKKSQQPNEVESVVLTTDGETTRMKSIFEMNNEEVLELPETIGPEKTLKKLRDREKESKIAALNRSDHLGMIDSRF